jgi:branched-chain amino acid aminotransferase
MQTPIEKAQISIMSKVVQYGLGWFGGVRGYISTDKKSINIFRLEDHIKRFLNSSKVLGVQIKYDAEQLKKNLLDLININRPQTDTYFRPFAYADSTELSPNFAQNSTFDFALYMVPLGDYIDTTKGNSVCVSSWRRVSDNAIPSRAKLAGSYVNSALAKQEAIKNGFVESIMLSETGEVTEGSAMNLFIVRDGKLITPSSTSDILEGITRRSVIQMALDMGIEVVERVVDRTELYIADEAFFCGTGAQVAWISDIDHRIIGSGTIGPITHKIQKKFFEVVRGEDPRYTSWLTKINID